MGEVRRAAVAGSWYPGAAAQLQAAVDRHLEDASRSPAGSAEGCLQGALVALVAPHAGLMYSGPVAGHAYRLLGRSRFDVIVIVGPSHFVGFDGVAVYPDGGFETPLGVTLIDGACASALAAATPTVIIDRRPHVREHSIEMQLPFLQRLQPAVPIVPLLMGRQTAETARRLADALAEVLDGRDALLIASTDLSHYYDSRTAAELDALVIDCVERFDAEGLQQLLDARPDHACGGGPTVAVMRTARTLGADAAAVLDYADSSRVSGDRSSVVGYLAAGFGRA